MNALSSLPKEQILGVAHPLPESFEVDLTRNVYAQYLELDGIAHVRGFGNSQSETGEREVLLLNA